MQIILVIFIILLILKKLFKDNDYFFLFSVSILISLGLIGFFGFLFFELLGINFVYSYFIMLLALIIFYLFLKELPNKDIVNKKLNWIELSLIIFSVLIVIRSVFLPVRGWDAYSMYDGRAKMMMAGLRINEMAEFNKYDDFNYMYYVTYPPMTSSIHAFFYSFNQKLNFTISPMLTYALYFTSFLFMYYLYIRNNLKKNLSIITTIWVGVFTPIIFEQLSIAYTNLVVLSYQVSAIVLGYLMFKFKSINYYFLAVVMLFFSNWTRNLEPISFIILLGLFYIIFLNTSLNIRNKVLYMLFGFFTTMLPIIIWKNYINYSFGDIGGTVQITLGSLISKIPEALYINNIIEVLYFVFYSLRSLSIHIFMFIFGLFIYFLMQKRNPISNFLIGIVVAIILTMTAGTFYFSVVYSWWDEISGSFLRSSLLIVPVTIMFLVQVINKYEDK